MKTISDINFLFLVHITEKQYLSIFIYFSYPLIETDWHPSWTMNTLGSYWLLLAYRLCIKNLIYLCNLTICHCLFLLAFIRCWLTCRKYFTLQGKPLSSSFLLSYVALELLKQSNVMSSVMSDSIILHSLYQLVPALHWRYSHWDF